jgi:replicative DNA helicase
MDSFVGNEATRRCSLTLLIAKQRDGEYGSILLDCRGEFQRFSDAASDIRTEDTEQ